jgi:hypothetical protein
LRACSGEATNLPGIYFLFGEDEEGAKPIVYIGQTEDARKRGKGELVEDGFVIHEGSKASMEVVPSGASSVNPQRERLLTAGVLEERNGEYVVTQDYLFTSPTNPRGRKRAPTTR